MLYSSLKGYSAVTPMGFVMTCFTVLLRGNNAVTPMERALQRWGDLLIDWLKVHAVLSYSIFQRSPPYKNVVSM